MVLRNHCKKIMYPYQQKVLSSNLAAGRLKGTNSVHINIKVTDDVMMERTRDFGKTL